MICEACAHGGRCSASNATKETNCKDYFPLCKSCQYHYIDAQEVVNKVRVGKKLVEQKQIKQVHRCRLTKLEVGPDEFCTKGKNGYTSMK